MRHSTRWVGILPAYLISLVLTQRKRNAHERQKEHYETGEWATGQKWADDAPRENVDPESVSLMSNGACGAFIHGLEDEYMGECLGQG